MNELFDKLIIRVMLTLFICGILVLYQYAHYFLYPSARQQLFKRFFPSKNAADTIHLFGRIIGIGILLSEFHFHMSDGIILAMLDFLLLSLVTVVIYLVSIYVLESIVLYNFEYHDEIVKKKNMAYALISFVQAVGLAMILKTVLFVGNHNVVLVLFLWLFAIVIIGFACKSYPYFSKLSFNRLLIQKNMAHAFSYAGFLMGWTIIISASLNHELKNIKFYVINILLKISLALIIFPLFRLGLRYTFKLQDDLQQATAQDGVDTLGPEMGYGVYEGAIFFTSCFLTSIIIGQIHFGTFYPVF